MISNKSEILENFEIIKHTIFDYTGIEADCADTKNEMTVVAELIQKCVNENAHTKLEQEEYKKRYEGLVSRFEAAKARFNDYIYMDLYKKLFTIHICNEVLSYFQQMNQDKIIAALQLAYLNINQSLYPEILNDDSLNNEQKHKMIKEKLNLDFISQGVQVMQKNLDHIKQSSRQTTA